MRRREKILIQVLLDITILLSSFVVASFLRLENFLLLSDHRSWVAIAISCLVTVFTFRHLGLYIIVVRSLAGRVTFPIAKGVIVGGVVLYTFGLVVGASLPRSVPIIFVIIAFLGISGSRFVARWLFLRSDKQKRIPVIIYGAGEAGVQLLTSLSQDKSYFPVAALDDDQNLHGMILSGVRVYPPSELKELLKHTKAQMILLAIANPASEDRRKIVREMIELKVQIKTIPNVSELLSGQAAISDLRAIQPEDLLGREPVAPHQELLRKNITEKVVMVSGAGGSIGSELCRQILKNNPKSIILYENSEFNLYAILEELSETARATGVNCNMIPLLGSVNDRNRVECVISSFTVETIYHAAAYKHVPLVEENPIEGIRNNIFGTLILVSAAEKFGVSNFILISTDKAVRPTNVMGATKRAAELICQGMAEKSTTTVFSMVRFGNVLGSSGSVIPRFADQIERGGPITVTHEDMSRYFMTIPEAAQLVIQAGALGTGGDVFILDMGEPVKIVELAQTMVRLAGFEPAYVDDHHADVTDHQTIPIQISGLRKGEKIYEELLIGDNSTGTKHPRIMTASESCIPVDKLFVMLDTLMTSCDQGDLPAVVEQLKEMPLNYQPKEGIFDHTWRADSASGNVN